MLNLLPRFAGSVSGATVIEYGLIASIVSIGLVSVMGILGDNLTNLFSRVSDVLASAL